MLRKTEVLRMQIELLNFLPLDFGLMLRIHNNDHQ